MSNLNKRDVLQCIEEDLNYYLSITEPDEQEVLNFINETLKKVERMKNE